MTHYYETLANAVLAGLSHKLPKGIKLDSHQDDISWEPMSYETDQKKSYNLVSHTIGENMGVKDQRKQLNVTIYRMPSGRYEVNSYVG